MGRSCRGHKSCLRPRKATRSRCPILSPSTTTAGRLQATSLAGPVRQTAHRDAARETGATRPPRPRSIPTRTPKPSSTTLAFRNTFLSEDTGGARYSRDVIYLVAASWLNAGENSSPSTGRPCVSVKRMQRPHIPARLYTLAWTRDVPAGSFTGRMYLS